MKQKLYFFFGAMIAQLMIANCVALGISMHELYSDIGRAWDLRSEKRKAEKELQKKAKQNK